jgi:hypothetical protein
MGESEKSTRALNKFFSDFSHPNRKTVADRYLGEGNRFVLGSIAVPNLVVLADYAIKMVQLWFWFGAIVSFRYAELASSKISTYSKNYHEAAETADQTLKWLAEQFNHVLKEERREMRRQREFYASHNERRAEDEL